MIPSFLNGINPVSAIGAILEPVFFDPVLCEGKGILTARIPHRGIFVVVECPGAKSKTHGCSRLSPTVYAQ